MVKDLEHVSYVEKRRLRSSSSCIQIPDGRSKKGGARHFSVVPNDRPRGNRHEWKWKKFQFVRVVKHWNRLHGKVVEPLSLEIFNIQHGPEQCAVSDLALSRAVGLDDPQRSFLASPMMEFWDSDSSS